MNPYYYESDEVQAELELVAGRAKHWFRYGVNLPSAYRTHYEELNTVGATFMAGGTALFLKYTPLLTVPEAVGLFKKAASLGFRPPGK